MLIKSLIARMPRYRSSSFKIPVRSFYKEGKRKIYTLDDIPVPSGSWQDNYATNNAVYNKVLAAGIILFGAVVIFGYSSECIYYRYCPPKTYEED